MDAVVNRHDGAARRQRRQHVVRRMKQVDARSRRTLSGTANCSRTGVARRRLGHRAEVRAAFHDGREVLLAAQDHVLGRLVLLRELPQQVAHVRADAVVAQLPSVDGDPHL